jgi:hypothetical protein
VNTKVASKMFCVKHFFHFLEQRLNSLIAQKKQNADHKTLIPELTQIVIELGNEGFYHMFLLPVEQAKLGSLTHGMVKMGITQGKKIIDTLTRQVCKSLTAEQVHSIIAFMESTLLEAEVEG